MKEVATLRKYIDGVVQEEGAPDLELARKADEAAAVTAIVASGGDRPSEVAQLSQLIDELPEPDGSILRARMDGLGRREIAQHLGLDEMVVFRSLVRTYAGLRVKVGG